MNFVTFSLSWGVFHHHHHCISTSPRWIWQCCHLARVKSQLVHPHPACHLPKMLTEAFPCLLGIKWSWAVCHPHLGNIAVPTSWWPHGRVEPRGGTTIRQQTGMGRTRHSCPTPSQRGYHGQYQIKSLSNTRRLIFLSFHACPSLLLSAVELQGARGRSQLTTDQSDWRIQQVRANIWGVVWMP